jgi:hypothetical protein
MLLIDTTPGPGVKGHVIGDKSAEGEHLRRVYLVTNLNAREFTGFMWDGKCLSEGAIPLHDSAGTTRHS